MVPIWVKVAEERTEHRFTLFGTDIDLIRPENFLWSSFLWKNLKGK